MKQIKRALCLMLAMAFAGAVTVGAAAPGRASYSAAKASAVGQKTPRVTHIERAQRMQASSGAGRRETQTVQPAAQMAPQPKMVSARFTAYAYCACSKCCGQWANGITATGTTATQGRTIAVDPKIIPLGTHVWVNGKEYIAEDTGVKGYTIDVFHNSHQAALQFGRQTVTVQWEA